MEEYEIVVTLEISQRNPPGQLRIQERVNLGRQLSIKEAAAIMEQFSNLAQAVQRK